MQQTMVRADHEVRDHHVEPYRIRGDGQLSLLDRTWSRAPVRELGAGGDQHGARQDADARVQHLPGRHPLLTVPPSAW
ncbi:hypothetical protein ACWC09_47860 [Streptomyces sp. NPDC001617]